MSNVCFGSIFPSDSATLTASSENENLPATALQDVRPGVKWQSAGGAKTNVVLTFAAASAMTFHAVALVEHNLTKHATVKVEADGDPLFGSIEMTQQIESNLIWHTRKDGTEIVIPRLYWFFDAPQSYANVRFTLSDAGNANNCLEAGRLVLFQTLIPEVNVTDNVRKQTIDPSIRTRPDNQFPRVKTRKKYDIYEVDFGAPHVDRDQVNEWSALIDQIGLGSAVIFALDPENHPVRETVYGVLEGVGSQQHVFSDQWEISGIRIREVRGA